MLKLVLVPKAVALLLMLFFLKDEDADADAGLEGNGGTDGRDEDF